MENHAIANAKTHLESIRDLVTRFNANEDGEPGDSIEREFDEYPLSVLVRDSWYVPGCSDRDRGGPEEYEILLTTGGPACRIVGQLDDYNQPTDARIEWQDWGTNWTPLHAADFGCEPSEADKALLAFASHFYYGDE